MTRKARRPLVARFVIVGSAIFVAACFADQAPIPNLRSIVPGFWMGLWHGIIAPIAFIVSLFSDHVRIYAFPNSGRWYDLGFMIGIGGFHHGVRRGAKGRRRDSSAESLE